MLHKLQSLLQTHKTSKVDHTDFQPDEQGQRKLIIKGITHRMVSLALKRESTKHLFAQRQKLNDLLKIHGDVSKDLSANSTLQPNTSSASTFRIISKPPKSPKRRPQKLSKKGSANAFQEVLDVSSPTLQFAKVLKDCQDSNQIVAELNILAFALTKDSKRVFESICRGYDLGKIGQLNPKRLCEEIDLSEYSAGINLLNVTKLEDLNKRKKDGLLIIFDPSTNTLGEQISLKITYMKSLDLNTEEEITKEYYIASSGNYFGLSLQREVVRGASPPQTNHELFGEKPDRLRCLLPGWQGENPLFIPAVKCKIELTRLDRYSKNAPLVNNVTRLRFYCAFATGLKAGLRRVNEFLEKFSLQDAANLVVPGGMSCLNYACLHGNLEAVQRLILCGASVNNRCKSDHHCSPLHEAVMGRNVQVVSFLLDQGANQLLKDDHGNCPLHYACKIGDVTIVRILMESTGGRRALLIMNNLEQKAIDICNCNYIRSQVEAVMRKHRIFVAPRISILDRS